VTILTILSFYKLSLHLDANKLSALPITLSKEARTITIYQILVVESEIDMGKEYRRVAISSNREWNNWFELVCLSQLW